MLKNIKHLLRKKPIRIGINVDERVTEKHVFIFLGTMMAYIVPKRALSNDVTVEAFLKLVNGYCHK